MIAWQPIATAPDDVPILIGKPAPNGWAHSVYWSHDLNGWLVHEIVDGPWQSVLVIDDDEPTHWAPLELPT